MKLPFQLPEKREFEAAGFGTNAVDYLIRTEEFPEPGSKTLIDSHTVEPGGEAASTIVGLQRLGHKTAYAGSFGNDPAGDLGIASLRNAGIDISHSRRIDQADTQVGFILVSGKTGERTVLWRRDERLEYLAEDAPIDLARRVRILHMTPHDTRACIIMARSAREAGTIVSLDIDNIFDGVEDLLPLVDICIASEELPARLTGESDQGRAISEMASRYGCSIVGATMGKSGSVVFASGAYIETPSFEVPDKCVDTTGAGDAFRAGFLHGVLSELSLEECCVTANAVASLKCRRIGARAGLPTVIELRRALERR